MPFLEVGRGIIGVQPQRVTAAVLVTPRGLTPEGELLMQPHSIPAPESTQEIPYGYCHCGCGQLAPIAKRNRKAEGAIKGEPKRFIHGHNPRQGRADLSDLDLPSGVRAISLTRGKYALVDAADYAHLMQWRWHAQRNGRDWYAVRTAKAPERGAIRMHRVIMAAPALMFVDHIDGDGLNNTRSNLRLATSEQNARNRRMSIKKRGVKGVYWHKRIGKWQASIMVDKKSSHLGYFDTQEDAAAAYDAAATELHGEFAKTNAMVDKDESHNGA